MEKSSTLQNYGCSTSQEMCHLLENIKGDDNYKTMHIKMRKYSLNQYTNKAVHVLCWRLRDTEEPSSHFYHEPQKRN